MQLTLAHHPVTEMRFGTHTQLDRTKLVIDQDELRRLVLEDEAIESVDFEIVSPGESCRAGPIFDIVQPRAKAPGSSADFPGILGPPTSAGMGTTHVLEGAAVSVLAERSPGESRSVTGRVLEMSGPSAEAAVYSSLQQFVVMAHTRKGLPIMFINQRSGSARFKFPAYLGGPALNQPPESQGPFEPVGQEESGREGLPRFVFVAQIFSRQRNPAVDEPILYGANTEGMLPIVLHPDEWLDGAIVPSLQSWFGGTETYFYQNHPVILELYRRHRAREINFVGTIATIAG